MKDVFVIRKLIYLLEKEELSEIEKAELNILINIKFK